MQNNSACNGLVLKNLHKPVEAAKCFVTYWLRNLAKSPRTCIKKQTVGLHSIIAKFSWTVMHQWRTWHLRQWSLLFVFVLLLPPHAEHVKGATLFYTVTKS